MAKYRTNTWLTGTSQYTNGKMNEKYLDYRLGKQYQIRTATPHEERGQHLGDREFTSRKTGETFYVEYKRGEQTAKTGNLFLEIISADSSNTPGWVYTCQARFIVYNCAWKYGRLLVMRPDILRANVEYMKTIFKVKSTHEQNPRYQTHGICVPISYALACLVCRVISVPPLLLGEKEWPINDILWSKRPVPDVAPWQQEAAR